MILVLLKIRDSVNYYMTDSPDVGCLVRTPTKNESRGRRITAITLAFQARDVGSTPIDRFKQVLML